MRVLCVVFLVGCSCGVYPEVRGDAASDAALGSGDAGPDAGLDAGLDAARADAGECGSDADCADGLFCDLAAATCTAECRTGTRVGIDVPTVVVELHVTLDGMLLPSLDDTGGAPRLSLRSRSSTVPLDVPLYEPDGSGSRLREDLRVVLAPNTEYDVLLTGGGALPLATNALIDTVLIAADTERVTIDVPSAVLLVRARLGGGPLPIVSGEVPTQVPSLWIYAASPSQGVSIPLYERDDGRIGAPITAQTVRVLPGVFLARYWRAYQESAFDAELPLGSWVAAEALDLEVGGLLEVDIPRARLVLRVTLDGGPVPPGGTGLISVVDEAGRATQLPRLDGEGVVSAWLVPGTYSIRYRAVRGTPEWPVTDTTLGSILVDVGTTVASVDVPRERLNLRARLGRTEEPAPACLGSVNVGVASMDLRAGETTSASFYVTPGRHDVRHRARPSCGAEIPLLAPRVLDSVFVDSETDLEVVLPMSRIDLDLRFDGDVPVPLETSGPGERGPELVFHVGSAPGPAFDASLAVVWASPGTYTVHYRAPRVVADAGDWPMTNAILGELVVADADLGLTFDVARTRVEARLTVGGAAVPSVGDAHPWGTQPPQVFLAGTGLPAGWSYWEPGFEIAISSHEYWAIPGRYEIEYDAQSGRAWTEGFALPPPGVDLGCWVIP